MSRDERDSERLLAQQVPPSTPNWISIPTYCRIADRFVAPDIAASSGSPTLHVVNPCQQPGHERVPVT